MPKKFSTPTQVRFLTKPEVETLQKDSELVAKGKKTLRVILKASETLNNFSNFQNQMFTYHLCAAAHGLISCARALVPTSNA